MTDVPKDIMEAATAIVDRIATVHVWKGDCIEDVATALLAERERRTPDVVWPIDTDDEVEALARECEWNNRRYMTPADYAIWCERMRKFARLAAAPSLSSGEGRNGERGSSGESGT